ncbi:hypothetical protein C8J57DRAFT_1068489 [Mycena rebaudengoi]|nr:hypothetical protein C8J57DRAFT_1068489 [Mycena rebaudengoi]
MTAGVHDGVTVRHLCCSVHDCTEPLLSQQARFCHAHQHLKDVCYIQGCDSPVVPGFHTCGQESHRNHELATEERHSAMFQLHSRLQNAGISQVPKAGSDPLPAVNPPPQPPSADFPFHLLSRGGMHVAGHTMSSCSSGAVV